MFGLFIIEAGSEPVALLDRDGKPVVVETGAEAAEIAKNCADGNFRHVGGWDTVKVQPRRLASDAWEARERARFADGTYASLPWPIGVDHLTSKHFAHVSTEDGAKIAYTQDATKGAGDIQTRVKPGKYLTQFYGSVFDAPTIARMAAEFSTQYGEALELLFAETADEMERVYTDGPSSCMSHDVSHFSSDIHPVRVYAAGDLAVAYMVRNEEITARVLCWPAKKIHGRIYGDETRLSDLLESASYTRGSLDGAKMLRIAAKNGFVVPYIDDCQCCGDNGTHLILGGRGVSGTSQNGLSEQDDEECPTFHYDAPQFTCDRCETELDENDCRSDNQGNSYCDDCYSEFYSTCEHYHEECDVSEVREVICNLRDGHRGRTTQYWGQRAQANGAFTCAGNGAMYSNDFLVTLADGTPWSQDYFEDNGSVCEGNSECYSHDDMVQLEDGTAWSKDYFSDNGVTVDGKLYAKGDEPEGEVEDAPAKPYRASPKMTLARPLRIETRDNMFHVMNGDDCLSSWRTFLFAEKALSYAIARASDVAAFENNMVAA